MARKKREKVVIMIPTYNEKENIQELISELLALPVHFEVLILIVDDDSPDGTGEIVKLMADREKQIHLIVRKKRKGRGLAGIEGFKTALELKADYIIEMDGDYSHQPQFIPLLLEHCKTNDMVIGSRFVKGGRDLDRTLYRKFITFLASVFVRRQLKLTIKDVNSGFRCFKRQSLKQIDLDDLISVGPSIVQEILYKASRLHFKISEVPITFIDRKQGKTKLNFLTLMETLIMVLKFKKVYAES